MLPYPMLQLTTSVANVSNTATAMQSTTVEMQSTYLPMQSTSLPMPIIDNSTLQDLIGTAARPREIDNYVNLLTLSRAHCVTGTTLARDITVTNVKRTTGVDLEKIHCSKTGQPIATLDKNEIDRILAFHGVEKIFQCADKLELASGVSRIWLHTDPDNLNKLQLADPKGFFCYCINIALQNQHMNYTKDGKKKFTTIEVQKEFRNSLVKAWYQLGEIPETTLVEANEKLRQFMYLDLHNKKVHNLPWHYFRIPTTDKQYEEILALYNTGGTTYRSLGKYGNKGVIVNPDNSDKRVTLLSKIESQDIALTNAIRTTQQHFLSTHGVNNNHVLPHELACQRGIDWIVTCLDKFVKELKLKLARQEVTFHTANAFRKNNRVLTSKNEIWDWIVEVGDIKGKDNRTLDDLKKDAKKLQGRASAKTLGLEKLIDLDLKISADGNVDVAEAIPVRPVQQTETIKIPKLKIGVK